jgi:hypothetical protein
MEVNDSASFLLTKDNNMEAVTLSGFLLKTKILIVQLSEKLVWTHPAYRDDRNKLQLVLEHQV